jgi:acetyltransferase-like isoleucine patch superfamily enzyme
MITEIVNFHDDRNNQIINHSSPQHCRVNFRGCNNTLIIGNAVTLDDGCLFDFHLNNATITIHDHCRLLIGCNAGENCSISIGKKCTADRRVVMSTSQGAKIIVGADCMFSSDVKLDACDAHSIYSVITGEEINRTKDIIIGDHVWFGRFAKVLGGSVGTGSVLGMCALTTKHFPNNCIIAGSPGRIVKRHISWERPHKNSPQHRVVVTQEYRDITREQVSKRQAFLLALYKLCMAPWLDSGAAERLKQDIQLFLLTSTRGFDLRFRRIVNAFGPPIF